MSWMSYVFPQTIVRHSSRYNRDIRVLEEKGTYKLLVNGSRQSGEYIRRLWQQAFCSFGIIPSPDVRSILVLGVGGGTVIHLLRALYPDAHITGIDVDRCMVNIGKKYFRLNAVKNLALHVADAEQYVDHTASTKKQWDMVVVDVFIGATIPEFVGTQIFFRNVKRIMTPQGIAVINYLREFQYLALSHLLRKKLKKIFRTVHEADINFNRFFMVK